MTRTSWLVLAGVLLALGIVVVILRRGDDCGPLCQRLVAAETRRRVAAERALDTARSQVIHDSVRVTARITRYVTLRDTLNLRDTVEVRVFVARADSVVKACTELQESCSRFRVRSDSVVSLLHVENEALAAEVKALRPSGVSRVWGAVRLPLAFVAGVYVGSRVVR